MNDYLIIKSKIRPYLKYLIIKSTQIIKHLVSIVNQSVPLTLQNTLRLKFKKFSLIGRTTQTQLSGKNKLDEETIKNTTFSEGTYKYTLTNIQGGTLYFKASLKEGKIPINGVYVAISSNGANPNNGTSIFSIKNGSITNETTDFSNISNIYFAVYPKTISIEELFETYNFWVSDTDTDYEEYCGGVPSPNSEFQQNINNVEGNVTIKVANGNDSSEQGYREQVITFPLAEGQKLMEGDYLTDDGIHHVRGQILLPAVTNLSTATIFGKRMQYAQYGISNMQLQSSANGNFKCNKVSYCQNVATKDEGYIISTSFVILTDIEDTINNMNQKYQGSILEYPLNQETIEPYTEAQQEAYNKIKNLHSYNNLTIIDVESSNLKPNVSLDYYAKGLE